MEMPEIKGLRLAERGLLVQDIAPDPSTNINSEFLWDYAVRRRAAAADIAGLMDFEIMNSWHEILKAAFLKTPPSGYRPVNWGQLGAADEALWTYAASKCERGTKAKAGETTT